MPACTNTHAARHNPNSSAILTNPRTCGRQQLRGGDVLPNSCSQRRHISYCCTVDASCRPIRSIVLPPCSSRAALICNAGPSMAATAAAVVRTIAGPAVAVRLAGEGEGVAHAKLRLELQGSAQGGQPAEWTWQARGARGHSGGEHGPDQTPIGTQHLLLPSPAVPHPHSIPPTTRAVVATPCRHHCPAPRSPPPPPTRTTGPHRHRPAPAMRHDGNGVSQQVCLLHGVCGQQHRGARLCPPPLDHAPRQPVGQAGRRVSA